MFQSQMFSNIPKLPHLNTHRKVAHTASKLTPELAQDTSSITIHFKDNKGRYWGNLAKS